MKNKEFTETEKETLLKILSSCIDIFEKDEDYGAYVDGGNFLCNLPTKRHVNAIESAYIKILMQ